MRLFTTVARATPGLVALCVTPDHVHVLGPTDVRVRLGVALGGFARWRNRRRGESGSMWEPLPPADEVTGDLKVRRNIRYIHLNPCRAGMVADPLAWPLSTHIDAVGLCVRSVRRTAHAPARLHRYVSGDPSVSVTGTDLPFGNLAEPTVQEVLDAVSMAARLPLTRLRSRGPDRRAAIRIVRTLCSASHAQVAASVHASPPSVARVKPGIDEVTRVVERWLGDRRCTPLDDTVLWDLLRNSRYRHHRR